MSTLRRRVFGGGTGDHVEKIPDDVPKEAEGAEAVQLAPISKIIKDERQPLRRFWRLRRTYLLPLGGIIIGMIMAGYVLEKNDIINIPEMGDFNVESVLSMLPSGMANDARDIMQSQSNAADYNSFSDGLKLAAEGLVAQHPVVMIPGVISTGLESWGTGNKSRPYFRKRIWGSWSMMRALVTDKEEWKRHIMLDKYTGLDPPGIKVRAAQGFDAADFFITGYWIWSKILENLATIGYDPTNSYTAAYDWRLSYSNLEVRDQYFTRLKLHLETAVHIQGKKVVLVSHSMGGQVLFYFFHWVAHKDGGKGGEDWVDKHIDSWINISGCMLGTMKGVPAVLSGEMKDTAQLNAVAVYGIERFLGREERAEIFRAMPGISSMLPIGGDAVWGNTSWAPDDLPGQNVSYGNFLNFKKHNTSHTNHNMTIEGTLDYLMQTTEPWYQDMVKGSYSNGVAHTKKEVDANEDDPLKWINPLETRLPLAPNLKIYCFYGVGKPAERSYYYRDSGPISGLNITIDTAVTESNIDHGVILGEGDGTVNLLSLGYMCNHGWKNIKRYNPAGIEIKVREMPHEPDRFNPRGGAKTGDHVDILGRSSLNEMILRIAAGRGSDIEEHIVSDIKQYSKNVKIRDEEDNLIDYILNRPDS